jgi:hypothetical protein
MAMAITMRIAAWILFSATEVTQWPFSSCHYTHIKRTPKPRCASEQAALVLKIQPK